MRNSTMAKRHKQAKQVVRRLEHMPLKRTKQKIIVMGKVLPKALYGCEVTGVPKKQNRGLATAIVDLFMPKHTKRRSPDIFWMVAMEGLRHPMDQVHIRRVDKSGFHMQRQEVIAGTCLIVCGCNTRMKWIRGPGRRRIRDQSRCFL